MAGRHAPPRNEERRRRGIIILAALLGLALSGVMVLATTRAAFTDTNTIAGNSLSTGTVILTDDAASALYAITGMAPGQSETRCVEVTYSGTITDPNGVVLYSGGYTGSALLAGELILTVREGTAVSTCSAFASAGTVFSGDIDQFDTLHTGYGSGVGIWDPSSTPETRAYQFEIALPSNATASGVSVTGLTFIWEVQS